MSIATALAWATSQVGVTEWPAGSNRVKYWGMWQDGTGQTYGHDGLPWCGAFLWCALHAGGWDAPADWIGVPNIVTWGKAHNRWHAGVSGVLPGDVLVFWNAEHTGLCVIASDVLQTIEGNTSAAADGSQANGGGVFRRSRRDSDVLGYVRVGDLLAHPGTPPPRPPTIEVGVQLPVLSPGDTGDAVRTWQGLLIARGHSTIVTDSVFGAQTVVATKHLQELHKLQATAVVDVATWHAGLAL